MANIFNDTPVNNADPRIPNQIVVRTGVGVMAINSCITKKPFTLLKYSTINEAHHILEDESIGQHNGEDFCLKYYGIGIFGSKCAGTNPTTGTSKLQINQHTPVDHNAFLPIPFAVRPLDGDFDDITRKKYAMRAIEEIDGIQYACYYLKLINYDGWEPKELEITRDPVTGDEKVEDYIPSPENINPVPIDITSQGSVPLSDTYINTTGLLDLSLNESDMQELINACTIKFKDPGVAAINEWYICASIPTTNTGPAAGGATVTYDESLSTVVAFHITETYPRDANANGGIPFKFDLMASLPMIIVPPTNP